MNVAAYALLIFALAVLIEGSVEYFLGTIFNKFPRLTPHAWTLMYVSLLLGIGVSIYYALDVIALIAVQAGLSMSPSPVGEVATGILIGRGANYVHQFISKFLGKLPVEP